MKIGIITFHWAANYGAVLQAYALQTYLETMGHSVEIINYKPAKYDIHLFQLLAHPRSSIFNLSKTIAQYRKDSKIFPFREKYLHLTRRFFSETELNSADIKYDAVISGSDQILNPSYTYEGEGKPTSVYYLTWVKKAKRIGYSVSFGCESYPEYAKPYAQEWINNIDRIGVREETGMFILNELGYKGRAIVTPDPTLLLSTNLFDKLSISTARHKQPYTLVYILRNEIVCKTPHLAVTLDETKRPVAMEEWLSLIKNASEVITNSYHGMIMSILFKVPFVVLPETQKDCGMNDRFYTLLSALALENRIADKTTILSNLAAPIDWESVESRILGLRQEGINFLKDL